MITSNIANRYSNANPLNNAIRLLNVRITSKSKKYKAKSYKGEYWLALYNDYWVADIETYKRAFMILCQVNLNIQHAI